MAAWTSAARQASNLARLTNPKSSPTTSQASNLIYRRALASATDHHGASKVNFWQDPMHPSKWKQEHFVIVSLAGSGLLIYGGYKMFHGNNKDPKKERVGDGSH